jgi:plasmid stabilization system protein ParE
MSSSNDVSGESGEAVESERVYAVRVTGPARAEIDQAHQRFADYAGEQVANDWEEGLYEAVRTLSYMPRKHALVPESAFFSYEVRSLLYRRRNASSAYRVYFTVRETADDGPVVDLFHVRHASRQPLTRDEANSLEEGEA